MDTSYYRLAGSRDKMCVMDSSIQGPLNIGNLRAITTYRAGIMQASSVRALRKHTDRILSPYGITKNEWLLIGAALDAGPEGISFKGLAGELDTTLARLDSSVKSLQSRGKVTCKNGKTLSQKVVAINPDFEPDCAEIERILRSALRESIYVNITPLEFRIYLKVLFQLSQLK